MSISLIAAVDEQGAIGRKGQLPWHLPKDFTWFRKHTLGKPVVMGRKTFDSLNAVPLKGRKNFVLSRTKVFSSGEITWIASPCEMFEKVDCHAEELMILGGASLYEWFLPYASRLYLTKMHTSIEDADAFFPQCSFISSWKIVEHHDLSRDSHHLYDFSTSIYERRLV